MYLIHKLKTSQNKILLDAEKAMQASAFATYTEEHEGEIQHVSLGWSIPVHTDSPKGTGHVYELHVVPKEIDRLIDALQVAKARFATDTIPGEVS